MDLRKAFNSIIEDEKWISKSLIGIFIALFQLLIIPMFVVFGYYIEVVERRLQTKPGLPAWDNFGRKIKRALGFFAVAFIYIFPIIILVVFFNQLFVLPVIVQGVAVLIMPFLIAFYVQSEKVTDALKAGKFIKLYRQNFAFILKIALIDILFVLLPGYLINKGSSIILTGHIGKTFAQNIASSINFAIIPGFIINIFMHNLYGQLSVEIKEQNIPT